MNISRLLLTPAILSCLTSICEAGRVPALRSLGAPAVDLESTWNDSLELEDGSGALDLQTLYFSAPLWGYRDGVDSFGLVLRYDWTQFDLTSASPFGARDLYSIDLQSRWAHLPKESGWLGMLSVSGGVGTDFQDFNGDAWQGSILGFWGWQSSPAFSWAVAGYAGYSLGEIKAFPGIGFVWSPSDAWRIQITPPLAQAMWKPDKNWRLGLSFQPSGGAWQVENTDGVEQVDLGLWSAAASVERRLFRKVFLAVRYGVNLGGELELRDSKEVVQLGQDLETAAFASVGLSWTF